MQLVVLLLAACVAFAALNEQVPVKDAENKKNIVKKRFQWKELWARIFPGDKKKNVCIKNDNGGDHVCETSEIRDDNAIAQDRSKWREFLSKLLKYFKSKSIVSGEMSVDQTSRWQLFVAYIESNLKVMVSESSENIKKSVQKSFETIRSKTKRFKANKDPYILVQYTANLTLNQVYNILKGYNQVLTHLGVTSSLTHSTMLGLHRRASIYTCILDPIQ